jgi:hypothetical protein
MGHHEVNRKQVGVVDPNTSSVVELGGRRGWGKRTSTTAPRYFAPGGRSIVGFPGVGVLSLSAVGMLAVYMGCMWKMEMLYPRSSFEVADALARYRTVPTDTAI